MDEIEVRAHGRWHPVDWLTLGVWVLLASLVPAFRRRYWSSYWTVSTWTRILYGPRDKTPSASLLAHERRHLDQAREHGRWRWQWRYLMSQRWRIWYEAEAYLAGGTSTQATIDTLCSGLYLITWRRERVAELVVEARLKYRDRISRSRRL